MGDEESADESGAIGGREVIHIVGVACTLYVMYLAVLGMISSGREFRKHYAAMKKQQEGEQ